MYVNFIPEDGGERIRDVYGQSKYRRLSQIKSRYDPDNLLRVNQNIKPALGRDEAARQLEREVAAGRLDRQAVRRRRNRLT
jgi:hypothetical protein